MYCFFVHLNYGVRTDGGIGDVLRKRSYNLTTLYYIGRFFYDFLFFLFVIIIMMSIVFGIVIDTFAELKEMGYKKEDDIINICYVCGERREDLEVNKKNFESHVAGEHCIWQYVEYMIGLKYVDIQETNAVNSYVMEMIQEKNISWFPTHSNIEEKQH